MKLKLLLFTLLISGGILSAQDTIRTLIITEANIFRADASYIELTNMGTETVNLADFELGRTSPWNDPYDGESFMLPQKDLAPGESFVIACVLDFTEKMHPINPDMFGLRITQKEYWDWADMHVHMPEPNGIAGIDSVTPDYAVMESWGGRDCFWVKHHVNDTSAVTVDQVGGVFDTEEGRNQDGAYDVAGVTEATGNSVLVRKFTVKTGNLNFADARGIGIDDSEWIPIPLPYADRHPYRSAYWTFGNHGNYKLDENSLVSDDVDIDYANSVMTVAWGTRNLDDFMNAFEQKPGLGWFYNLSLEKEDSAFVSARNGDQITIYACGEGQQVATFDIMVAPPTADANIVLPKIRTGADGYFGNIIGGNAEVYEVTTNAEGMDTITNGIFGIGYASRVDTLVKYLEKAPKASWEIVWVDDTERASVIDGDILKVTAENGDVKEYYLKVDKYRANHNADLSSITWPDMPEWMYGLFGWVGDTIPGYASTVYNYNVQVPFSYDGIPGLIAKTQELNSKVDVKRATSLQGTDEQKTVTFTVTAEDDTTTRVYNIKLEKDMQPQDIQPYHAEPFLSELVFRDQWANGFVEICNPGNQVLDLSNYMFTFQYTGDPAAAIANYSTPDDWMSRFAKYVPGYKWVSQEDWAVTPAVLEQDLNVSPLVFPRDVFVMGEVSTNWALGEHWFATEACDVIFNTNYNPWGEEVGGNTAAEAWSNNNFYIFKILNDSIKAGLKAANDPNDFELIEIFGSGESADWLIGGHAGTAWEQTATFIRKPEFYVGNPIAKATFGTTWEDSEWIYKNRAYWNSQNVWWVDDIMFDGKDLGKHFMNAVTSYMSTVSSVVYKVDDGYVLEGIKGMSTGTTVADFLGNIIKKDEGQGLKVNAAADGSELPGDAILSMNDTLIVMSADSMNITKYVLEVSESGLSSNAVLTSTRYEIEIQSEPKSAGGHHEGAGTVSGFEYGTTLNTVVANITIPTGASMDMIDGNGAYIPLKRMNFDTTYVNVTVNDDSYFSVTAENGTTTIVYKLVPQSSADAAFITSDIYSVSQKDLLVHYVPRGTTPQSLFSNLVPSAGSTVELIDKLGHQRTDGTVADDDRIVVTSADGNVIKVYFISMLAEEYIPESTYLAFITSNRYAIDQVGYMVDNVDGATTIADFYSKITPAMGATAVVVDKDGVEKTSGDIDGSDMVKVTSADGRIVVMYEFGHLTSSEAMETSNIELYPNPTNGVLNISGLERGNRIQVFTATGSAIRDIHVQSSLETVSLHGEPSGMYLFVISDEDELIGRYKAIKK